MQCASTLLNYPLANQGLAFDNPDSDYRIIRGNPKAAGRIDLAAIISQHGWVFGLAPSAFNAELGDELQTILMGRLRLTRANGESINASPAIAYSRAKVSALSGISGRM